MEILILAVVVLAALCVHRAVQRVPPGHVGIVERLGRYRRTAGEGWVLLAPGLERLAHAVDLRPQTEVFPAQPLVTADHLVVQARPTVAFTVTDPRAARYEVADVVRATEQLTITTLRNVAGGLTHDELRAAPEALQHGLAPVLDEALPRWGLRAGDAAVELEPHTPSTTQPEGARP